MKASEKGPKATLRIGVKLLKSDRIFWSNYASFTTKDISQAKIGTPLKVKNLELDSHCFGRDSYEENLVIQNQNQNQYSELLKDRQSYRECPGQSLPRVDFKNKTVLAQYVHGGCSTEGFKREVFRDDKTKSMNFTVTILYRKIEHICSGPGSSDLNLIAVPKIPADYKVNFHKLTGD